LELGCGWLPWSAAETLLLLGAALVAVRLAGALRALARGERRLRSLLARGALAVAAGAGALYLAFLLLWGLNHARRPLSEHLQLEAVPVTTGELLGAAARLARDARRARERLPAGAPTACALEYGGAHGDPRVARAWEQGLERYPFLVPSSPRVRRALSSPLLSWAGLTGVYSPFTAEPHVNGELPPLAQPFTALHELAHRGGIAREDEANFLAWRLCALSADPALRYSGAVITLGYVLGALQQAEPGIAAPVFDGLDQRVRADCVELWSFWRAQRTPLTTAAARANDLYLRGHGQAAGGKSYGLMVELIVAWRRSARDGNTGG